VDVLKALRSRRSIGKLGGDVSDDEIRTLVEAGLWAPNHKLTNPWRFTVVRGDARVRLGAYWAELLADAPLEGGVDRASFLAKEARKPTRAPVLIAVSTRTDADPVRAAEDFAAASAAVQNVLLAAHALGLGAIWRTGPMAYRAEINAFLGLEADDRIVGFVYVGRPGMAPPTPQPRDVDAYLRFLD
jgi:nitroreductase